MNAGAAEKLFKALFTFGVILAIIVIIGIFLLALKIILLFAPELHIMGMTIV